MNHVVIPKTCREVREVSSIKSGDGISASSTRRRGHEGVITASHATREDSVGIEPATWRLLKPLMNLSPPLYRGTSVQPSPSCFFVTCRPSTVFSSGSITAFTSVRKILNEGFNTRGDYFFYRRVIHRENLRSYPNIQASLFTVDASKPTCTLSFHYFRTSKFFFSIFSFQ